MAADLVELAREIHLDPAEAIFQAAKIITQIAYSNKPAKQEWLPALPTADVKHIFQTQDVKNKSFIFVAQRYQNFQLRAWKPWK